MTISELYRWAIRHECEEHQLYVYNEQKEEYCRVKDENLEVYNYTLDPDDFDELNFVEIKV